MSSQATSSIIVTSQMPLSLERCSSIRQITGLSQRLGSELLLSLRKSPEATDNQENCKSAMDVSEMLGGSPLFLVQASAVVNACGYSLEEYLSRPLLGDHLMGVNKRYYERSLVGMLDYTIMHLTKNAQQLLFIIAFLDHNGIQENLLLRDDEQDFRKFLPFENNV